MTTAGMSIGTTHRMMNVSDTVEGGTVWVNRTRLPNGTRHMSATRSAAFQPFFGSLPASPIVPFELPNANFVHAVGAPALRSCRTARWEPTTLRLAWVEQGSRGCSPLAGSARGDPSPFTLFPLTPSPSRERGSGGEGSSRQGARRLPAAHRSRAVPPARAERRWGAPPTPPRAGCALSTPTYRKAEQQQSQ